MQPIGVFFWLCWSKNRWVSLAYLLPGPSISPKRIHLPAFLLCRRPPAVFFVELPLTSMSKAVWNEQYVSSNLASKRVLSVHSEDHPKTTCQEPLTMFSFLDPTEQILVSLNLSGQMETLLRHNIIILHKGPRISSFWTCWWIVSHGEATNELGLSKWGKPECE